MLRGPKENVPGFISTDWPRYFHFKREVLKKTVYPYEYLKIPAERLGWKIWLQIRKLLGVVG
jgi:hypothetical protein